MQRVLDTLALLGLSGVLLVAFWYQLVEGEMPCPLCALQRVGFIVAGVGLVLNLRAGYSPSHYGIVLLSAVAAGSASLRQIALHVVPDTGTYGSALLGFRVAFWLLAMTIEGPKRTNPLPGGFPSSNFLCPLQGGGQQELRSGNPRAALLQKGLLLPKARGKKRPQNQLLTWKSLLMTMVTLFRF